MRDIKFGTKKKPEKCLKLINFNPVFLNPKESIKITVSLIICRKMLRSFQIPILIDTEGQEFEASLRISLPYIYFKDIQGEHSEHTVFYTLCLIIFFQMLTWFKVLFYNRKKKQIIWLKEKVKPIRLISENSLEEKLKIYKAEITLKTIEILNK